jgi:hypothetical protein
MLLREQWKQDLMALRSMGELVLVRTLMKPSYLKFILTMGLELTDIFLTNFSTIT